MTQPISGYRNTDTDELLRRTMEVSGDHDPSRIQADTGQPLHYDATRSASGHREGLRSNGTAERSAIDAGVDTVRDQAIDRADTFAEHALPALPAIGALGPITGAVVGLGSLYKAAIEGPAREGEAQRALGASDAGVVAMAQALDVEPGLRGAVAQAHAGSDGAAAAMAATLMDPGHAGLRAELQLRADKGLTDAAGYARMSDGAHGCRTCPQDGRLAQRQVRRYTAGSTRTMRAVVGSSSHASVH